MTRGRDLFLKSIVILLSFLALTSSITVIGAQEGSESSESDPRSILILNSYDHDLPWTNDLNDGIFNVLNNQDERYSIYIEYMDWKNYPNETNLDFLREYFQFKYSLKKIDVIIATDDAALSFALNNRNEIFSDAFVVFSGVNDRGIQEILPGHTRVTGVIEELDPAGTVEAALKINPDIDTVYTIFDNTESGLSTGTLTMRTIKNRYPDLKLIQLSYSNINYILEVLRQADDNSIVICTTYSASVDGRKVSFDYFCRMLTQHSRVPVYQLYDFGIGCGVIGGSMISGSKHGEEAARLALGVLHSGTVPELPFVRKVSTSYIFDYEVLQKFHVNLDSLPEGSTLVNKPFSFFEEHREVVYLVIIVFSILVIFIFILLYDLGKINLMKKELLKSHMELTGLYEDLTAANNKLKQQYGELVCMRQDLTLSESRYELILNKMMSGYFIIEPVYNSNNRIKDFRFIDANPEFFQQMRIPREDISGKTWYELMGYRIQETGYYESLLETGIAERFEAYYSKTGSYYLMDAFLISESQIGVVLENITEYKNAIKEVKTLNAELEKRVSDRTAELEDAVRELEAFSYTVSHDLKSPLRAVDGYVKILLEDFSSALDDDSVQMLRNISTISQDAIEMINKLLQYSKTSRAELNKEEVDIGNMIKDVYNELRLIYPERDINLVIETALPLIYVDKILFRLLLQNILSNALKFTKDRERAVITVGCSITAYEYYFYVKDNGVGFDMKYSSKLFGVFQRLHTADEFEGSGIGLITVKKIIEKHGGRVWIEGKADEGAVIYFTVPIKELFMK